MLSTAFNKASQAMAEVIAAACHRVRQNRIRTVNHCQALTCMVTVSVLIGMVDLRKATVGSANYRVARMWTDFQRFVMRFHRDLGYRRLNAIVDAMYVHYRAKRGS
jgi:hypothetical protein